MVINLINLSIFNRHPAPIEYNEIYLFFNRTCATPLSQRWAVYFTLHIDE
ncbi:Uncharacterised protein [Yersinia ruckeri]|uniref:Uncharacterized protein n=1 Tax=Yersinia ruckeri TaxID=29486 RepID=A0A085U2F7_YERRU|nr:hypothetical protein QMA0440_00975 [Yersinia ruckeri]EEQ00411.1 hypothetical protein yruck0001_9350 [Yersinia ruckeri ATCC 29473]KFE37370.1 hypothetical protein nADLYRO1b_3271 [Yersinia ruckeri]QTD77374.1 Uncharacterized protein YR821_2456 [Yersinia ruckeri]CEK28288.1 hypothetical protein CSF007_12745 [Yersinia ruckeri]